MFIHFGMSTFVGQPNPDGAAPANLYHPDQLDVDSWVQLARDSGMKYAVLTAKHVAGHCLWPSRHTDYTVANSGDKTDVIEAFVRACDKHRIKSGLYYCSWDNHNRFGSVTATDTHDLKRAFTTSEYQTFQTRQITELLTNYGPIAEMWVDIPIVLGRGYREFLYRHIAAMQPRCVIMMNNGIGDGTNYPVDDAWPSDLIAIERRPPPASGHVKWREIEGKQYYLPGEACDVLCQHWFFEEGDTPRSEQDLAEKFNRCRAAGVNLLLDVAPNRHGLIPADQQAALKRLRRDAGI
jgi:alpha-L-fucosidase